MIVYFDSGTTNSRGYLLSSDTSLIDSEKRAIGSKDSAIAGDNSVLIDGLYEIYTSLLRRNNILDADVERIYASGMVTSPYGLCEIPHVCVPISLDKFVESMQTFREEKRFHRDIRLICGLKTQANYATGVNNLRGEEIEVIGAIPELTRQFGEQEVAVVMPGSHTHTLLVKNGVIEDLLANFTGELFAAIRKDTILAPILNAEVEQFDADMIALGVNNLRKYGFTRALYICHAMRLFNEGTPTSRASYAEGVILGGLCQSLDQRKAEQWKELKNLVVIADEATADIYCKLLKNCQNSFHVHSLLIGKDWIPALEGIRALIKIEERRLKNV